MSVPDLVPDWLSGPVRAGEEKLIGTLGGRERTRSVLLLAGILSVSSADQGAVGAMAPQLESAFRVGNLDIGILVTISSLVGALCSLPMGVLADRYSRVRIMTVSIVLWAAAEAVSGAAVSYVMFLLIRVALGMVTATGGPTVASLTGDLFPARDRARIYGFVLTGELLGAGAGLLIAGDIGAAAGWRVGFAVLAVPSLLLAWALHRWLPEPARGRQGSGATSRGDSVTLDEVKAQGIEPDPSVVLHGDVRDMKLGDAFRWVFRVRTNVYLIVSSCLGYFFFGGLKTFAVLFARGRYGISQSVATLLVVGVGVAAIAGILTGGRIADRLVRRGHISGRLVVGASGYLICVVFLIPALLTTNLGIALPLVIIGSAALSAPNPPVDAARLDVVPSRMWGRTEAIRTMTRTVLEAFAPLLFGYVSQLFGSPSGASFGSGVNSKNSPTSALAAHGLAYTFLVMLVPLAASGWSLLMGRRTYPTDVASAAESESNTTSRASS